MKSSFSGICEAAAAAGSVPALAVGAAVGDDVTFVTVGCEVETRFRIASITKPFTALLAAGVLDPDAPAGVWPDDVRVRHLLSHLSGFACELPDGDLTRFGDGDGALAAAIAELPAVPRFVGVDEIWSYANTGYWLAGHLCALAADATFEEALAERILRPFGLEATSFAEPDLPGGRYPRARRPSGGLVSNVRDLVRFGRRLLAEPAFERLAVGHGRPVTGVYGLGLFGRDVAGTAVWGHPGEYDAFHTSLLVVPEREAVLAVLANGGDGRAAVAAVEDAFLAEVLGAPREEPPFVTLPDDALAPFAGSYENETRYEVRIQDGALAIAAPDFAVKARPIGSGIFRAVDRRWHVDFPRAGLGRFGSRLAACISET